MSTLICNHCKGLYHGFYATCPEDPQYKLGYEQLKVGKQDEKDNGIEAAE